MGVYSIDFSVAFFLVDIPPISLIPPIAELTLTSYLAFTGEFCWAKNGWLAHGYLTGM